MLRYLSVSSAAKKNLETKKAANIQKEIDRNYNEKKAKHQFIEERIKLNHKHLFNKHFNVVGNHQPEG